MFSTFTLTEHQNLHIPKDLARDALLFSPLVEFFFISIFPLRAEHGFIRLFFKNLHPCLIFPLTTQPLPPHNQVMATSPQTQQPSRKRYQVELPPLLRDRLVSLARRQNKPLGVVVREAVAAHLARHKV